MASPVTWLADPESEDTKLPPLPPPINIKLEDIQLQSFDDPAAINSWDNTTAGSFSISGSADAAEGTGSIAINYNIVGVIGYNTIDVIDH